ncbi:hypothetical protein DFH27DRAFT_539675 [Peziza echinospora]|nr:hypothetical protein DFH27DRAFT_539675 [Peziza echinospora]
MWTLECDGEALSGKKLWLRPGATYVIGRAQNAKVNIVIPQKSISRVHLIIHVGEVPAGNGFKILSRSTVTIEGLATVCGTKLDGEPVGDGEQRELESTEHVLHLAKYEPAFRIKWQPAIFSFSLSTKEKKEKKIMGQRQSKVEKYDIKTLEVFTPSTTHVVASKRNTAIGLQALVNARYLVTEDYLDAIVKVAAPNSGSNNKSLLEDDFDLHWPNPMDYVPASSNEPNPREKEVFAPNPERQNIFEGWTVIFCEQVQYENFLGPITDGGGKLERYDLVVGQTTARNLVDFVEKRSNGNTAIVRFRGKGPTEEWCNQLSAQVSEILNLRMVEQNEFLDIILTCDPNRLRKPLEEELVPAAPPSTEVPGESEQGVKQDVVMEDVEAAPARKPRRRLGGRTQPTPKVEIMDLFSMPGDPLPAPAMTQNPLFDIPETQQRESILSPPRRSTQVAFRENSAKPDSQEPTSQGQTQLPIMEPSQNTRKRSPESYEEDPDLLNKLFPGTAAMKKRRIEEEEKLAADREHHVIEDTTPPADPPPQDSMKDEAEARVKAQKTPIKGKRTKPENPILAAARANIKEEEDKQKKENDGDDVPFDEEAIKGMKNMGIVEFIEIKPRIINSREGAYGDESDRWDPRWNGRPNFKGFRKRAGENVGMRSVRGRVIIPLVEHKASGMEDTNQSALRAAIEVSSESEEEYPAEENTSLFRKGRQAILPSQRSQRNKAAATPQASSSQTVLAGESGPSTLSIGPSGGRRVSGESSAGSKRGFPGGSVTPKEPASKRAKKFLLTTKGSDDEDSDDEDDKLKFSFKKRG